MVSSIGGSTASSMFQRLDASQMAVKVGVSPAGGGGAPPAPVGGSPTAVSSTAQSSSTTKTYDPADTNQDGTVSAQELLAYLNAQANKSASAPAPVSQNQSVDASVTKQMLSNAYANFSQDSLQFSGGTISVKA